ncbi:winged helix-turn-helix domain-containing protein [uncultured Faecalibaculum sp.]|uniref:winged helix-turn-helix domain-containing protein n=1 Tax=uncultured Faecalibaculum sp. TaxID=1729681 RepID=UPI0025DB6BF7|nr:winged helix-turn-helix domain-containing protein [uncultured Faecalibaculum sp.]
MTEPASSSFAACQDPSPEDMETLLDRAMAIASEQGLQAALEFARAQTATVSQEAACHNLLGILLQTPDPEQARVHYCASLLIQPDYLPAAVNLKNIYREQTSYVHPDQAMSSEQAPILMQAARKAACVLRAPLELVWLESIRENTGMLPELLKNAPLLILHPSSGDLNSPPEESPALQMQEGLSAIRTLFSLENGSEEPDAGTLAADRLVFCPETRSIMRQGQRHSLTPLEFRLLSILARQPDRPVAAQVILEQLYGPAYGSDTQSLRSLVLALRKKTEQSFHHPRHLVTVAGFGYQLRQTDITGSLEPES